MLTDVVQGEPLEVTNHLPVVMDVSSMVGQDVLMDVTKEVPLEVLNDILLVNVKQASSACTAALPVERFHFNICRHLIRKKCNSKHQKCRSIYVPQISTIGRERLNLESIKETSIWHPKHGVGGGGIGYVATKVTPLYSR